MGAVLLFHAGFDWAAGGFAGIDVFFVLSGFLITTLLLSESRESGRISIRSFWRKRFRRLLPAVLAMLAVVAVGTVLFADPSELGRIRSDGISTLLYVNNWAQIIDEVGYFELFGTPSPLLHTWSLSVEEQYYLIWPVVIFAVVHRSFSGARSEQRRAREHRNARRAVLIVAGVGAAASAALMVAGSLQGWSVSRLYFGTDTRAQALLVGSALAVLRWGRWRREDQVVTRHNVALDVVGLGGLAIIGAFIVRHWADEFLNRGGYSAIALGSVLVITAATDPQTRWTPALLATAPLRLLGKLSYSAYLWHWPIFVWLSPQSTGWSFWPVTIARFALTLAASALSLWFIENPFRHGSRWRPGFAVLGSAGVAVALIAVTTGAVESNAARFEADERRNELPPTTTIPPPPEVTRVMVVGDSLAASVAAGGSPEASVDFVDATFPECGRETDVAGSPGGPCGEWRQDWRDAIRTHQPDVVLLVARSWHPLSQDPQLAIDWDLDIAKPTNLLIDEMGQLADMIAAEETTLLISTPPDTALDIAEISTNRMFSGVALQTATVRGESVQFQAMSEGCEAPCDQAAAGLVEGPTGPEVSGLAGPTIRAALSTAARDGTWSCGTNNMAAAGTHR